MYRLRWPGGFSGFYFNGDGGGNEGAGAGGQGGAGDQGSSGGGQGGAGAGAGTFTKADLDKAVQDALKADREAAKRKADEDRAKEQGEWEKLAKQRETELAEATGKLAAKEREILRDRIARKHNLPEALANRLQGDDEASLEKDAESLAKLIPAGNAGSGGQGGDNPTNPGSQGGDRGGLFSKEAIEKMTPDQINANWDKVQRSLQAIS